MLRRTLAAAFACDGTGIHLGQAGRVRVGPAPWGEGITVSIDGGPRFPVALAHARAEPGATVLIGGGGTLRTPEHLLAALIGCGITDARIDAWGPEVPALDGSAAPWCASVATAGTIAGLPADRHALAAPIRVAAHGGVAEAWPADRLVCEVSVAFDGGPSGEAAIDLDAGGFAGEVAWARTFALEREVGALRAMGRGAGATAENTVIWGPDGPLGPVRAPDEAVRHKLLDLVGDLALAPHPLAARVRVVRGSHALHHALVAAITAA